MFIPRDARDIDQLRQAVNKAVEHFGSIEAVINNVAREDRHQLDDFSVEQWDNLPNTNLRPHFFTTQMVAEGIRSKSGGSVI